MSIPVTRLLVLGVVRLRQPVHGYEIQRELTTWNADQWANIAPGSVYNQLRNMSRNGLLRITAVEQDELRPSRTLFEVTPEGEAEFGALLNDIIFNEHPQPLDMLAALCFLPSLTRAEVEEAITKRMATVKRFLDSFPTEMSNWFPKESQNNYIQEILLLTREAFIAECNWGEAFLVRVRSGQYQFATKSILPAGASSLIRRD